MSLYPLSWEHAVRALKPRRRHDMRSEEHLFATFLYHDVERRHCDACRHGYAGHDELLALARRGWWVSCRVTDPEAE